MRIHWPALVIACATLAACGKEPSEPPAASSAPAVTETPAPTAAPEPASPALVTTPSNGASAALSTNGLDLARKGGCLACHSIEKKVVGPAWKDVAARYKNDANAKAALVAKVKQGGKGNWTDITGGVAMPPYSPRVSDADIAALVDFVLAL